MNSQFFFRRNLFSRIIFVKICTVDVHITRRKFFRGHNKGAGIWKVDRVTPACADLLTIGCKIVLCNDEVIFVRHDRAMQTNHDILRWIKVWDN